MTEVKRNALLTTTYVYYYLTLLPLRSARSSDPRAIQPVWWDAGSNGGFGAWRPEPCALRSARAGLVWFSCNRMGYYSYQLLKESLRGPDPTKPKFRYSSTIVHTTQYTVQCLV